MAQMIRHFVVVCLLVAIFAMLMAKIVIDSHRDTAMRSCPPGQNDLCFFGQ